MIDPGQESLDGLQVVLESLVGWRETRSRPEHRCWCCYRTLRTPGPRVRSALETSRAAAGAGFRPCTLVLNLELPSHHQSQICPSIVDR
jgi:hypothetical protein